MCFKASMGDYSYGTDCRIFFSFFFFDFVGSSLPCTGFPLRWLLLLRSTGSRPGGFSSCGSGACGIFLDEDSNQRPLNWQVDS